MVAKDLAYEKTKWENGKSCPKSHSNRITVDHINTYIQSVRGCFSMPAIKFSAFILLQCVHCEVSLDQNLKARLCNDDHSYVWVKCFTLGTLRLADFLCVMSFLALSNTHVVMSQVRNSRGYGMRWSADGSQFRGFIEPQAEDGHDNGWVH